MMLRWCIYQEPLPAILRAESWSSSFALGSFRLVQVEFSSPTALRAAQADLALVVCPGLETDAGKLPPRIQSWLAERGVGIEPGDRMLHLLRKVRAQAGLTEAEIDISTPD